MIDRRYFFVLILSLAGLAVLADSPPMLRATVNELAPRSRRAAPEWIEVLVNSRSTAIREGALEFTMIEWANTLYRYRTHDLVINSGDQRFRFMLPAATSHGENSDRTLRLKFIEKDRTTPLGEFPLIASQGVGQTHVIAVIRPSFRAAGNETHPIWQALRLERLAPEEGSMFDTVPVFLDPADLPQDPLGFFPFDLVLIESVAYGKMREKARAALARWVNAGGSLCVIADRTLEPEHVEALNQLGRADPLWEPLTTDESGQVKVPGMMAFSRVNFGRMAVASELPPDDVEKVSPAWRRASVFLWRLTTEQAGNVEQDEKWNLNQFRVISQGGSPTFKIGINTRLQRRYPQSIELELPAFELFPKSVRVIPLWVLATLIGVFLILIGPVDWFLLGAIRRHRFTWLAFPMVAVSITAATVFLAQRYMGQSNHEGAVIISDIGVSGRVIRETRIEFSLPASQKLATSSMKNALRLPVIARFSRSDVSNWDDVMFQGQYPARFDYVRPHRQWTPDISRVTAVVDAPDVSGIKWDAFDAEFLEKHKEVFQKTRSRDRRPSEDVLTFLRKTYELAGRRDRRDVSFSFFTKWGTRDTEEGPTTASWRQAVTLAEPLNPTLLITQPSPNGFPQIDDLRILERADPSRTVILAAIREGKDIHVWRRLYLH
jgi:hypothetical protein